MTRLSAYDESLSPALIFRRHYAQLKFPLRKNSQLGSFVFIAICLLSGFAAIFV
jgi:hypothetical protein